MKKISFNEKRKIWIESILTALAEHRICLRWKESCQDIIDFYFEKQMVPSRKLETIIKVEYGEAENTNDLEYIFCKILTLFWLIKNFNCICSTSLYPSASEEKCLKREKEFLDNVRQKITEYFSEYEVENWNSKKFIKYKSKEYKTVIDNLKDIPEKIAKPIVKILEPMLNENELIGCISKIYKDFEKRNIKTLENLNEIDKKIYQRTYELAKMVVNNVEGAKGHQGQSKLSVKDIAHNFALNASLIQKLINLNDEKK